MKRPQYRVMGLFYLGIGNNLELDIDLFPLNGLPEFSDLLRVVRVIGLRASVIVAGLESHEYLSAVGCRNVEVHKGLLVLFPYLY